MIKIIGKSILGVLCISVGLYPAIYFIIDPTFGLLASKSQELLANQLWNLGFYGHIVFGGMSLTIGWTQFVHRIRLKRPAVHRLIGKLYIIFVLISGSCAVYIAFFATGGIIAKTGFLFLGLIWLSTTILAYRAILQNQFDRHEHMMIYSYAACFAAVTLRIWLPILTGYFGEFLLPYQIVSWLCWVPNMLVAWLIVRNKTQAMAA